MKKRNFNPNNYNNLNNLRNKVIVDINRSVDLDNKKILEIGSGSGIFSTLLGKKYKNSYIHAIDIVKDYIDCSSKKNKLSNVFFEVNDINKINGSYDGIFMVFSLTELLKKGNLENLLNNLNEKILIDGYLFIVDEFESDYNDPYDLLGLKVLKSLGYKYLHYEFFLQKVLKSNFEIVYTKLYENNQKIVDVDGAKLQIYFENKLNEFDNSKLYDSKELWDRNRLEIEKLGGIRTYNKARLVVLKKKNNIINLLQNVKSDLCLYYSLTRIEANIKYYNDLSINNLEFIFPVKAFPNNKILNLFDEYNFHYDVSHEGEENLVKKYDALIFYSDPTNKLKNKNSMRLNLKGLSSHFGKEYDGRTYEIYHIHLSLVKNEKVKKYMLNEISRLDFSKTKYLNIGGGYDGLNYLELYSFINEIRKRIPFKVKILLEAGSLWFKECGYLITKVEYISNVRGINFVYLNGCRELHSKWSIPTYINTNAGKNEYILCGSSCDEKDLFAHVYNSNIEEGNRIYFSKIEPYSYSFNTSFNGITKAEVVIDE